MNYSEEYMKTKSFQKYLEKRLNKNEIQEIEKLAKFEKTVLYNLQKDIAEAVSLYMKNESIGFNELVRRLDISPTQAIKIQKGQANLTLATIAHLFALLKQKPHFVFKSLK